MQKGKSALPFLFKTMDNEIQIEFERLQNSILALCLVEAAWQKRLSELSDCYEFNAKPLYCDEHKLIYDTRRARMEVDMCFYDYVKTCNNWHSYINLIELCCEAGLSAVTNRQEIVSFAPPSYMGDYVLGKTDTLSDLISKYIEFCSNPLSGFSPNYRRKLMEYQNSFIYFIKAAYDKRMEL